MWALGLPAVNIALLGQGCIIFDFAVHHHLQPGTLSCPDLQFA